MEKYYYNCEDGEDNGIDCFETFEEAMAFAEECERVKEIWTYEITEDGTMGDFVGLVWLRNWFK